MTKWQRIAHVPSKTLYTTDPTDHHKYWTHVCELRGDGFAWGYDFTYLLRYFKGLGMMNNSEFDHLMYFQFLWNGKGD